MTPKRVFSNAVGLMNGFSRLATGSITAVVLATSIFAVLILRELRLSAIKDDLEQDFELYSKQKVKENEYPEELIREQLARNYAFLGESGQSKLRGSYVIVVGLGGVGSHAAHMLARAGVSRLLLIDFDQLTLSSLNRHALGTLADVGLPKTTVMLQHLSKIVPFSDIRVVNALFFSDNAEELLQGSPDFVLDCIDNIDTKIHLIKHCLLSKIPLISSMGASGKADPSRIVIGDISESSEDPLARKCRQLLRAEMRQGGKFKCVYSLEKECTFGLIDNPESSEKRLAEGSDVNETTSDQSGKANGDYALLPKFRSRTLPVLGPIPALFGNMMATHVITELSSFHTDPLTNKLRQTTYIKQHQELLVTLQNQSPPEQYIYLLEKLTCRCTVSVSDVAFLFEEVWRARSALSFNSERVKLVKWDNSKPASIDNLILLKKKESIRHATVAIEDVVNVYGQETVTRVEERFLVLKRWNESRQMQM